jgi:hypothetical protein
MKRKITKQKALHLLEEVSSQGCPVLVHGTSVEAVIELLSNGRLPPSRGCKVLPDHHMNRGYLYFVPRKKSFVNHPLYDKIKIDLDGSALRNEVRHDAENNQGVDYLRQLFGYWPLGFNSDDFTDLDGLQEEGVDIEKIEKYGLDRLESDLEKRKGVVIGINEKIFELKIEDGSDDPGEEVMIYLPEGLDIKYVHYICPMGELERKALRDFIQILHDQNET